MSSSAPASNATTGHGPERTWRWLESQLKGRPLPPVLTIIGLGDAVLLEALDTFAPAAKVLAIEPGPVPARTGAQTARMQAWLDAGRLVYVTAPAYAGADHAWRIFPTRVEAPPLIVHPSVSASAGLKPAVALLKKIVFGVLANADARRRLAPGYLLNSLRNLPAIAAGRDVRDLAGCATGVPAVVVGAGPSLDRSIDDLRRLGHRAFIVATDTSLRPLLRNGIVPHAVIALDPSEINGRHLRGLPACADTWLIAESALDPTACAEFAGRTFWFRVAPHQPWPWLNRLGIDVGRIEVWGSVLTGAFEIASLAGCDPIVLVGADLSFPDGRPYARGTTYEYYWAWQAATGTSVHETWRAETAGRAGIRTQTDVTGADTLTTGVMIEFRDWLVARARKSGRRVINATGRGLLFGDGVEQLALADALADAASPPPVHGAWRLSGTLATPAALLPPLGDVAAHLGEGRLDVSPLPEWVDFTAGAFDAVAVGSAVRAALAGLESVPVAAEPATHPHAADSAAVCTLARLPESLARLRTALRDEPLADSDGFTASPVQRGALLLEALGRLSNITATLWRQADLVSGPDPARVADVPAGAIAMWPETVRWDVLEFEGLLGEAWSGASPAPEAFPFAAGAVSARRLAHGQPVRHRPHASYSLLLLALEWTRGAASAGDDASAWLAINQRLRALERCLQSGRAPRAFVGPLAELVIEASAEDRRVQYVLPLGVSEAFLARVLTGAMSRGAGGRWELGQAAGAVSVRVAIRSTQDTEAVSAPGLVAPVPRIVSLNGCALKVAGQLATGALCVVHASSDTVVLTEDGRVEPYQSWPQPITGALSLGEHGDVAWSHAWSAGADGAKPYLMYRKAPGARVAAMPLPFRPSHGVWWRERLYLTSLPTTDAKGGVGVWAPGGQVTFAFPNMTLQGVLDAGDALQLEPYVAGAGEGWGRQRAQWGWTWTPGAGPAKRQLAALGAASSAASRDGWLATAYPQSDLVIIRSPRGDERWMRCYSPLRLAWAGRSLAVTAAEGVLLLFENVLAAV